MRPTSAKMTCARPPVIAVLALAAALCGAAHAPLAAQEAWVARANEARVSLLAGGAATDADLRGRTGPGSPAFLAGVDVRLNTGWKTYWRAPGDGIPPHFDWSGSENLADLKLLWPVPRRFISGSGQFAGYAERVVFPVIFTPSDPARPVRLRLRLEFAVCREICLPEEVGLERLVALEADSQERALVLEFVARTPRHIADGACAAGPSFARIERISDATSDRLEVDLIKPRPGAALDLFTDRLDGSYLPMPRRISPPGESPVRFSLPLDVGDHAATGEEPPITLTGVADDRGCETAWPVALLP